MPLEESILSHQLLFHQLVAIKLIANNGGLLFYKGFKKRVRCFIFFAVFAWRSAIVL